MPDEKTHRLPRRQGASPRLDNRLVRGGGLAGGGCAAADRNRAAGDSPAHAGRHHLLPAGRGRAYERKRGCLHRPQGRGRRSGHHKRGPHHGFRAPNRKGRYHRGRRRRRTNYPPGTGDAGRRSGDQSRSAAADCGRSAPCRTAERIRRRLFRYHFGEGRRGACRPDLNGHLGIVGGISILGTSGIVEPMSEKALVDTIRLSWTACTRRDSALRFCARATTARISRGTRSALTSNARSSAPTSSVRRSTMRLIAAIPRSCWSGTPESWSRWPQA